jgi:NADH-quinone oxidoreductase subunit A
MQNEWLYISIFLLPSVFLPALVILIIVRASRIQLSETYECGIETVGATWVQFKVQYYIFAFVFLLRC